MVVENISVFTWGWRDWLGWDIREHFALMDIFYILTPVGGFMRVYICQNSSKDVFKMNAFCGV